MATFISHNPEETFALGEIWGKTVTAGRVIALHGDLGAGKTQLVKGIARGLSVRERVLSPTFALVREYRTGRIPLHHLDLYRLNSREEILGAGLEEFLLFPIGVSVIEWPERWVPPGDSSERPGSWSWVSIECRTETQRLITYEPIGS